MVSVIIPAYQAQDFIEETVDSVLAQTVDDLEVIIVNDGSTDNTVAILEKYKKNQKVSVFNVENGGVSNARNVGYRNSNGDYLAFLDADDVWLHDNLETKINMLDANKEIGLVHSDCEVIDQENIPTGETKIGKSGKLLESLLLWDGTNVPAPSSILVRRKVIEVVGEFDTTLSTAADQEFFFRVADKFEIGRVEKVTWYYRVHDKNMHQNIARMERDHIKAYKLAKHNKLFKSWIFKQRCFSNLYLILAGSWWGDANRNPRTFLFIFRSFFAYPPNFFRIIKKLF